MSASRLGTRRAVKGASSMVLPAVDTQGYVRDGWVVALGDSRVPRPIGGLDGEVRVYNATSRCVDEGPRHLWDIIESAEWHNVETDAGEWLEEATFREVLTCVRCGVVEQREGTRRDSRWSRLEVEPLQAGKLRAQQVKVDNFWSGDAGSFVVVDEHSEPVGRITWDRGPRGRGFYVGRLGDLHPRGDSDPGSLVEAPTALGVLRKLATRHAVGVS